MGLSFPERPQRIKAIKALLEKEGIWDVADKLLYRRLVTKEEACLAHTEKHWLDLEKLSTMSPDEREEWNKKNADFSLFCCADTWDAARLAAGGVLVAIDHIFVDGFRGVIFCWIRPPAHHASHCQADGFCFLNSCAIAAKHAVSSKLYLKHD